MSATKEQIEENDRSIAEALRNSDGVSVSEEQVELTDHILSQFKTKEQNDADLERLLTIDLETLNQKAVKWGLSGEGKLLFLGFCTISERTELGKEYDPATDFDRAWEIGMAGIRRSQQ